MIREKAATREGKIGTAAAKVAGGLESASCYLQERKFDHLGEDSESWFVATLCGLYCSVLVWAFGSPDVTIVNADGERLKSNEL